MAVPSELERDLQLLATELRRLEAECTRYFGGRLARVPNDTRARVEAVLKRLDAVQFEQVAQRFRFQTLQSRYVTLGGLWDRGLRRREEGRSPATPSQPVLESAATPSGAGAERVLHDAAFRNPVEELDRLEQLYAVVRDARRDAGERPVPFHRFAQLVNEQVKQIKDEGADEVSFRVAVSGGKVRLIARATKKGRR